MAIKTYIKVTNKRLGDINVHNPPLHLPPGESLHEVEFFATLGKEHKPVLESLLHHEAVGELKIELVNIDGDAPIEAKAPSVLLPFLPEATAPEVSLPPDGVPALSEDPARALEQIATETNSAVLDAWFSTKPEPSPEVSDAIMNRIGSLS